MHMQLSEQNPAADWSAVAAFASAVDASLDKWLADTHRVGLTEFRALTLVARESDKELRVNELAHRVGLNQSSATRLVSRLETKGLARRDVCSDDGRGVYAVITPQGEELVSQARQPFEERVHALLTDPTRHFPHLDVARLTGAWAAVGRLLHN